MPDGRRNSRFGQVLATSLGQLICVVCSAILDWSIERHKLGV